MAAGGRVDIVQGRQKKFFPAPLRETFPIIFVPTCILSLPKEKKVSNRNQRAQATYLMIKNAKKNYYLNNKDCATKKGWCATGRGRLWGSGKLKATAKAITVRDKRPQFFR